MSGPRSPYLMPAVLLLGVAGMLAFGGLLGARYGPFRDSGARPSAALDRDALPVDRLRADRSRSPGRTGEASRPQADVAVLTEQSRFRGRLLDPDGQPLAGVPLSFVGTDSHAPLDTWFPEQPELLAQTTTDEDGSFTLSARQPRQGRLLAELAGGERLEIALLDLPQRDRDFRLADPQTVLLKILDPLGRPAPGLEVQALRGSEAGLPRLPLAVPHLLLEHDDFGVVFEPGDRADLATPDQLWRGVTDADGRIELESRRERLILYVTDAGGFPHRYEVPTGTRQPMMVRLHALHEAEFPVSEADGSPLPEGAEVFVAALPCWGDFRLMLPAAQTGQPGRWRAWSERPIAAVTAARRRPADPWLISTQDPEWTPEGVAGGPDGFRVPAPRAGRIEVRDPAGRPVPGLKLTAFANPFRRLATALPLAGLREAGDGVLLVDRVWPGQSLLVEAPGFHPALAIGAARWEGQRWTWEVELHPSRPIEVAAQRASGRRPVPGVLISSRCPDADALLGPGITDRFGVWRGDVCADRERILGHHEGRESVAEWDRSSPQARLQLR